MTRQQLRRMSMEARLKIESDGTMRGTRLIDTVTGEVLSDRYQILELTWKVDAHSGRTEATIVLSNVAVDVRADEIKSGLY